MEAACTARKPEGCGGFCPDSGLALPVAATEAVYCPACGRLTVVEQEDEIGPVLALHWPPPPVARAA